MKWTRRQHRHHTLRDATNAASGFSLLEVLVAMTILAIIVVMVAMVFQQSTLAWQSGVRRAEGNMTLRSLIGFMQREMSQAVDARAFGLDNRFSANEAEFVVLVNDVVGDQERSPRRIRYFESSGVILRQEFLIRPVGDAWQSANSVFDAFHLNSAMPLSDFAFIPHWPSGVSLADPPLPTYVEIRASISQEGDVSSVGVWSLGPDRTDDQGEGDDVRSW